MPCHCHTLPRTLSSACPGGVTYIHRRNVLQVEAFKYFWIKAINVGTLVFQLYRVERDAQSAAAVFHSAQAADLHACNMTLGVAKADAECPTGLVCCDENCDNALNSTALYVSLQRHIERQQTVSIFLTDMFCCLRSAGLLTGALHLQLSRRCMWCMACRPGRQSGVQRQTCAAGRPAGQVRSRLP